MAESPSLNSTTSKEARADLTKPSSPGNLPPYEDSPATAAAAGGQERASLRDRSSGEGPIAEAQQQDEAAHRQKPPSIQSSESHQEQKLDQGGLGQCGSHDFAYGGSMLEQGGLDSGSDSGDMSAKGAKRSRLDPVFCIAGSDGQTISTLFIVPPSVYHDCIITVSTSWLNKC